MQISDLLFPYLNEREYIPYNVFTQLTCRVILHLPGIVTEGNVL